MIAARNQIGLNNGREHGYAEIGELQGQPILCFHGWPSSRLEAGMVETAAQDLNLRIPAPWLFRWVA
ncbi:MAG: hypothetical protein JSV42_15720 [Chloroflexota bacterium]|nr:MAG: hypothetical protein JSV42_15720 [Chloroflexota bacterium]